MGSAHLTVTRTVALANHLSNEESEAYGFVLGIHATLTLPVGLFLAVVASFKQRIDGGVGACREPSVSDSGRSGACATTVGKRASVG